MSLLACLVITSMSCMCQFVALLLCSSAVRWSEDLPWAGLIRLSGHLTLTVLSPTEHSRVNALRKRGVSPSSSSSFSSRSTSSVTLLFSASPLLAVKKGCHPPPLCSSPFKKASDYMLHGLTYSTEPRTNEEQLFQFTSPSTITSQICKIIGLMNICWSNTLTGPTLVFPVSPSLPFPESKNIQSFELPDRLDKWTRWVSVNGINFLLLRQ